MAFVCAVTGTVRAEEAPPPDPAAATGARAVSSSEPGFGYVIGPQNTIQIKIFNDAGVSQIYRVDDLGFITHALVGRVRLAGQTVAEAEKFMESRLAGDYIINPQVTIFILEHSRFSVLGEVQRPGTYEILGGHMSIIEAISIAGGFTPVANQKDVKILRSEDGVETTIRVNVTKITQGGDRSSDVKIQANDAVVVAKSFF